MQEYVINVGQVLRQPFIQIPRHVPARQHCDAHLLEFLRVGLMGEDIGADKLHPPAPFQSSARCTSRSIVNRRFALRFVEKNSVHLSIMDSPKIFMIFSTTLPTLNQALQPLQYRLCRVSIQFRRAGFTTTILGGRPVQCEWYGLAYYPQLLCGR